MSFPAAELGPFERLRNGAVTVYLRAEQAASLRSAGLLSPWNAVPASALERGRAASIEVGGRRYLVKRYCRGGLAGRALRDRYAGAGRFLREIAARELLARRGLTVPRILCLALARSGPFLRAWTVSEYFENLEPLGAALRSSGPRERRRLARAAGAAVGAMHAAGVLHPDLTLDNIQRGPDGGIVLIDFDRCSFSRNAARARLNLFRLHRSALKSGLWAARGRERSDTAAFAAGYREAAGTRLGAARWAFLGYRAWERAHALFWKRADA